QQARGMRPDDAASAARRQFGNVTQIQEISREAWGWRFLDTIRQDVRYALRTLGANKGFTATAVLSLALGIGANTAVFSILNAVMLRTLPVEDPHRLVQIRIGENAIFTNPIWEQVRDNQQAFSGVLAFGNTRFDLAEGGESRFVPGLMVSGDYFRVLGVPAIKGRVFSPEDDDRGDPAVAVISHNFWQQHFQADPDIVGKTVRLNRVPFEIVGVSPPWFGGFDVDQDFEVAIPIACRPLLGDSQNSLDHRSNWWLRVLGRLQPAGSIEQAGDRMKAIAPEIFKATLPDQWRAEDQARYLENSFALTPAATGYSATGTHYQAALYTLLAIVGLVLLIACANIANLLLARAAARQREFSMRMAIGASRRRVIRQLLTESLLLSLLGSAIGFLLALWGSRVLVRLLSTTRSPLDIDLSPDLRVLAFTTAAACFTALLFGLAPALRATRLSLNHVLKDNARGAIRGAARFHLGKALVAGQIALSLILLVGAALFAGTLRNLLAVDLGLNPQNVLFVTANFEQTKIPREQRGSASLEILDRFKTVPGILAAATFDVPPLSGMSWNNVLSPEGYEAKSRWDTLTYLNRVSPGYFETIGTPILLGRDFNGQDRLQSPLVMILGEKAAKEFFPDQSPIGKTVTIDEPSGKESFTVIGVVKDIKYRQVREETQRTAYVAAAQDAEPRGGISYAIRSAVALDALKPIIRSEISEFHPGLSLEFRGFESQISESLMQPRVVALLSTVFGSLALLLAMIGLYGVTAYGVAGRHAEIGIRMALGAQATSVIWLVLRDVLLLLVAGMALGVVASVALGRLIESLLFGLQPEEPSHLIGAAVVLSAATVIAAYLPARRAARLNPMTALREE
ncbi:MAG: ABC transporter permease, partial [Bryobacterales bacterium]